MGYILLENGGYLLQEDGTSRFLLEGSGYTAKLYSTVPGTSENYIKYLYDYPTKDDQVGNSILLTFTLADTDAGFVKLHRGNYIIFETATYGIWYTGYINSEPTYVYLGAKKDTNPESPTYGTFVPHWGYTYQASSDELILSMNALGIVAPFMNMTQGQILTALANAIAPGVFDTSNIQPGLTLARYVVNPTQTFADVVSSFCSSSVHRFYGKNKQLFYVPFSYFPQALTVSGTDIRFTPSDLTVAASTQEPIVNDAVVMGHIEPQRYTVEYFVGDGYTGAFPLSASVFGVESVVLLTDNFGSSTISTSNWSDYDEPENYLQISNGFLNCLGGLGDTGSGPYAVHLDSANTLSLGGAMRLAHGEFDFIPQTDYTTSTGTTGVICSLWTAPPNGSFAGCIYGIQVQKSNGVVTINPIVNGVPDTTQSVVCNTNGQQGDPPAWDSTLSYNVGQVVTFEGQYWECIFTSSPGDQPNWTSPLCFELVTAKRYVIRTLVSSPVTLPRPAQYNYIDAAGVIHSISPFPFAPQVIQFHTYITELDPNTGLISTGFPVLWTNNLNPSIEQLYASYVLLASDLLQCTVTGVTLSTPMQCTLGIQTWGNEGNGGFVNKLVGPNEIDATDGLAPYATIAQSGGANAKSSVLGTPTYNLGTPTLTFFKDTAALSSTTPQQGDIIQCSYRSAGASVGRCRDNASVMEEQANWGDSGVRSAVHLGDLTPLPTNSQDCETVAAAIIGQNSFIHYTGHYKVPSQNVLFEPVGGMILPFSNLPDDFPTSSFVEPVTEVVTSFVGLNGNNEFFTHDITFGLKGASNALLTALADFTQQNGTFIITDTTQTPVYVPVTGVGLSFASDITNPTMDPTNGGNYPSWSSDTTYSTPTTILDSNGNLQELLFADFTSNGLDLSSWTIYGAITTDPENEDPNPSFLLAPGSRMFTVGDVTSGCTVQFDCYFLDNAVLDVRFGVNNNGAGPFFRLDTRSGNNSGFGISNAWATSQPVTVAISTPTVTLGAWHLITIVISNDGSTAVWSLDGGTAYSGSIALNGLFLGFGLPGSVSTLGTDVNNISVSGGTYSTGPEEPVWANVENAIVEIGSVITCQYVMVISNVLYIVSPVNIQGMLNIGTVLSMSGFETATFLNPSGSPAVPVYITVASIPTTIPAGLPSNTPVGSIFTANFINPNYGYTSDVGNGTVTQSGGLPLTTPDGTATWQLKGHAYAVDENNFYFDMGQLPPGH